MVLRGRGSGRGREGTASPRTPSSTPRLSDQTLPGIYVLSCLALKILFSPDNDNISLFAYVLVLAMVPVSYPDRVSVARPPSESSNTPAGPEIRDRRKLVRILGGEATK